MFAHQVIDDIKKYDYSSYPMIFNGNPILPIWINGIKNAQKFNLLNAEEIIKVLKPGKRLLLGEYGEMRMPIKSVGLIIYGKRDDIESNKVKCSKRGILVSELNHDLIIVFLFFNIDYKHLWIPAINFYLISINKNFSQNEFYKKEFNPVDVTTDGNVRPGSVFGYYDDKQRVSELIEEDRTDLSILETTLLLLSCNNIGTLKHDPPVSLNKKREKNGKQPLFSFHTLVIKPTTIREKNIPQNLWHNRIHLCRGHFKLYTSKYPLFGKLIGRYWWQAFARGNKELGIIEKDYKINERSFISPS